MIVLVDSILHRLYPVIDVFYVYYQYADLVSFRVVDDNWYRDIMGKRQTTDITLSYIKGTGISVSCNLYEAVKQT